MRARLPLPALLDQVRQRLIDKRLKLPALALRELADLRQDFGTDLGGEFFSG